MSPLWIVFDVQINQWGYSAVAANAYLLYVTVGCFVEILVGIEYTELRIIMGSTSTKANVEMSLATNCLIGPQIRRERCISISQSRRLGRNQVPMKGLKMKLNSGAVSSEITSAYVDIYEFGPMCPKLLMCQLVLSSIMQTVKTAYSSTPFLFPSHSI